MERSRAIYTSGGSVRLLADTLDEAVKAYNEERVEHRMSTHKITAEHRAVVEEMQRRRKLFVGEIEARGETPDCRRPHRHTHPLKVPAPPPRRRRDRPARPALEAKARS